MLAALMMLFLFGPNALAQEHKPVIVGVIEIAMNPTANFEPAVDVPLELKRCQKDSDCEFIVKTCSCCTYDSVNKTKIVTYENLTNSCRGEPPPPCSCRKPKTKLKCQDHLCIIL